MKSVVISKYFINSYIMSGKIIDNIWKGEMLGRFAIR